MKTPPQQLNKAQTAQDTPRYAEPILGNPVSTLMESGVGNCFPGLEFDLRQLDVRFFPGLVFEFPGITPAGPDGRQGARLVYADPDGDPILGEATIDSAQWIVDLKRQYAGPEGAALGDGDWYLFWVEQDGQRIEMYDYALYQNAATRTPYEGETCWWIIRLIEPEKPLTIALTQRGPDGSPSGTPVTLTGRRRMYLDGEGMIDEVYHPGELTSSMCSPWTHDFRDCACQYWASNHPDVALGEVKDPQDQIGNRTDKDDPIQAVNFVDWMRRRSLPLRDVSAQTTIERARPDRYDPYEINLKWQELDFVIQGQETRETPLPRPPHTSKAPYKDLQEVIDELENDLSGMELTLALEYLYAYFSLRAPDEVTEAQETAWPGLREDLRGARQLILSVALSEMTHLRWVNQVLWLIYRANPDKGEYCPVLDPAEIVEEPHPTDLGAVQERPRALRRATQEVLESFVEVERPGGHLDTEYVKLVEFFRKIDAPYAQDLLQLAVRIDSDGMQHFQKFRDVKRFLAAYAADETLYLRPVQEAKAPFDRDVQAALQQITDALEALRVAYLLEAHEENMPEANAKVRAARDAMHRLHDMADALARKGVGVPFFAVF